MASHKLKEIIKSPVDKVSNTVLLEEFDSSETIALYQKDFGIDVKEYFPEDAFQLRQCSKTKYRFFYPQTLEGKEQLYVELHNNRSSYYGFPKWEHITAIEAISNLNLCSLLEIGCATGDFIAHLKENTSIQTAGIELNKSAAETGRNSGLTIYDEIIEEHVKKGFKYDMICSFQVVEHIFDINSFFTNSIKLLEEGGYIVFGVPHSNPYLYYFDRLHTLNLPPHHVGLWDEKTIKNIAKHFNLKIIQIKLEKPSAYEIETIIRLWRMDKRVGFKINSIIINLFLKVGRKIKMENFAFKIIADFLKGRNIIGILQKQN